MDYFYTAHEVATMFRLSAAALASQRKRGIAPGSLAVKVGGKFLYPTVLIDRYLDQLAEQAQQSLDLDGELAAGLFRTPPTSTQVLDVDEAAARLGMDPQRLTSQWEENVYPGALGWRPTPDGGIVFGPREVDIWIQANANQDRQDAAADQSD